MGQGVQSARQGVSKVRNKGPSQFQLHLQPLNQKNARLCTNVQLLYTCSKAKTHNMKVVIRWEEN